MSSDYIRKLKIDRENNIMTAEIADMRCKPITYRKVELYKGIDNFDEKYGELIYALMTGLYHFSDNSHELVKLGNGKKTLYEIQNYSDDCRALGVLKAYQKYENKIAQRLPGLDGNAKMSKSLNNGIYLSDPSDIIYKKVMSMYTDPNHIKVEDPGKVEGNMVFTYLDVFSSDEQISRYSEYKTLDEMKKAYEKGGLGDVKIKKVLYNVLEEILSPIREKRRYYEEHLDEVYSILKEGTNKANEKANKTLKEVKKAIMIDFFEE